MTSRHPATQAILQFFEYRHLSYDLQQVSARFHDLAHIVADGPANAETTIALRKLLEAKDAAVRAHVWQDPTNA